MPDKTIDLHGKLAKLETLVDALLEENKLLRNEVKRLDKQLASVSKPDKSSEDETNQALLVSTEELRASLVAAEAINQRLMRERNIVRGRLEHVRNRLDQIEGKLLEQRSVPTAGR